MRTTKTNTKVPANTNTAPAGDARARHTEPSVPESAKKVQTAQKAEKTNLKVVQGGNKTPATSKKTTKSTKSSVKEVPKSKGTPAKANKVEAEGYSGHRAGSRKGAIHQTFDSKGREAALAEGKKAGLKESTLNQWFNTWTRSGTKAA